MYKSRIRLWGLDKKNKSHEVQQILQLRAWRKAQGKKSIFTRRGRVVDMADIERYAKRKRLELEPEIPSSSSSSSSEDAFRPSTAAESMALRDLVCFTPPPTPKPLGGGAPLPLRNIERFLHAFYTFVDDSLQSGLWRLGKDVMGFACILDVEYPRSVRDRFFLSIERGVKRYNLGDISQAYRQWRVAFDELRFVVGARRPSQLLCLVELVAHLAECKDEVANLLLRYLGDLAGEQLAASSSSSSSADARVLMLQCLSRLNAEDLAGLTTVSQDCSRHAFSGHFYRQSFFLLDSETILMENPDHRSSSSSLSSSSNEEESSIQLANLVAGWDTSDVDALRAARSVMEILMASQRYEDAERVARMHIQRMMQMEYTGVVGGAFSHAYSYLTHLYLMPPGADYEKAYNCTLLKVDNYFRMLTCRTDLPEDFILPSYSLLASLAQTLGMPAEAETWRQQYAALKARTDALAQQELDALKARAQTALICRERGASVENENGLSRSQDQSQSHGPETLSGISVEDFRKCQCHTVARGETGSPMLLASRSSTVSW